MRELKRYVASLLLVAMTITCLPMKKLEVKVSAEENIPQYLEYQEVSLVNATLCKDKVFATISDFDVDNWSENYIFKSYDKGVEKFSERYSFPNNRTWVNQKLQDDTVYMNFGYQNNSMEAIYTYKKYNFNSNEMVTSNEEEYWDNKVVQKGYSTEYLMKVINEKFGTNYTSNAYSTSQTFKDTSLCVFEFYAREEREEYRGIIGDNVSIIVKNDYTFNIQYDINTGNVYVIDEIGNYEEDKEEFEYIIYAIKDEKVVSESVLNTTEKYDLYWGWHFGKDLYIQNQKNKSINHYVLKNGEYKIISSIKTTNFEPAIDIYGNPWFVTENNGKSYVCTIEGETVVKKYEIANLGPWPDIYAYDESNIVVTSEVGTIFINEQSKIDKLYAEAYNAMLKAQADKTQKNINEGRLALDRFCEVIDETGEIGLQSLANTISAGLDKVQGPIYVKIVDMIVNIQNKGFATQEEINEVRIILEGYDQFDTSDDVEPAYAITWHSVIDSYQQKLCGEMINAVEKAQQEQSNESVNIAQALVDEVSLAIRKDIKELAQIYQDILNKVIIKESKV